MTYTDDELLDDDADRGRSRPSGGRSRQSGRQSAARSGRRPAARRPASATAGGGGSSPLQQRGVRLAILVGVALVLILVLITSVRGCQRDRLVSSYKSYMAAANAIGGESQQLGQELQVLLENKQFKAPIAISKEIAQLGTRATELSNRADELSPPESLKAPNNTLITVLQYRRDGLRELAGAVEAAAPANAQDQANIAATLLEPLKALGASDVIFKRSFLGPAQAAFQKDDVKDVNVQPSYMFPDGAFDDASQTGVTTILSNLRQTKVPGTPSSSSDGNLHGLDIQSVFAIANGQRIQLSQGNLTTVPASPDLAFEVTVEDGGDFVERNVPVDFVYSTPSDTAGQKQTQTIVEIQPGAANAQKVTFKIPTPYTRAPSQISVKAGPVEGEVKTDNNEATYQVQFQVSG